MGPLKKRMMKLSHWIAVLISLQVVTAQAADVIYDVAMGVPVTRKELLNQITVMDTLIIGEKHYSPKVQQETAQLLKDWSNLRADAVTLAWEFLNWSDRARIQPLYKMFNDGMINSDGLMKAIFGPAAVEVGYAPMFDELKSNGGYLLETNLTRTEKAPVTAGGITALDPALLPPNFALGNANYLERFEDAMKGHVDPAKIPNYFAAQCLVDDVVAYHIDKDALSKSVFLVIGSFHMLYSDGVESRIRARSPLRLPMSILVDEAVDYPAADRAALFKHLKYGKIADYVILKD